MENRVKRTKRHFSEEFKKEAVELGQKLGNSHAARELGLNESQIRQWRIKFNSSSKSQEVKSYSDLERENRRLNKELEYLNEINKVLKKSTAIFSVDQLGNLK